MFTCASLPTYCKKSARRKFPDDDGGGSVGASSTVICRVSVACSSSASVTVRVTVYVPGSSNVCSTVCPVLPVLSSSKAQLYSYGPVPPSALASNVIVAGASPPVALASISAVKGSVGVGGGYTSLICEFGKVVG